MAQGPTLALRSATSRSSGVSEDRLRVANLRQHPFSRHALPFSHDVRPSQHHDQEADTRLYVGNLLYSVRPEEILQFFADHNIPVANLDMSLDPISSLNPSFCFVDFYTSEHAAEAKNFCNGKEIRGRPVRINARIAPKGHKTRGSAVQTGRLSNYGSGRFVLSLSAKPEAHS
jgi:hypothetical protein